MNERIVRHMEQLFETAPNTRRAMELKEEMTQNANEKYQDLLEEGYSEEAAYQNVIASIGDVSELFEALEERSRYTLTEEERRKKAVLTAAAVGMYILAGVAFFFCVWLDDAWGSFMDYSTLGIVIAGIICIPPTCMLVFAANMYPNYEKDEDNMVEEYKEKTSCNKREKAIMNAVSSIIWTLTVALYFVVSFTTFAWYITWIILLMGGCVQAIASLIFNLKRSSYE